MWCLWYSSLLLCGGVHSVHAVEAISGSTLTLSIPDEPPEMCSLWCLYVCGSGTTCRHSCTMILYLHITLGSQVVALAWREGTRAFVHRLSRGFGSSGRRPHCVSSLVTSGSVISALPQSSLPIRTPQAPLLQEPSTAVVQVCCGTVISSHPSHHSLSLYSLSLSLSLSLPSTTQSQNLSQTTIISFYADSFIQVRQDKQCAHSSSPSHTHVNTVHTNG